MWGLCYNPTHPAAKPRPKRTHCHGDSGGDGGGDGVGGGVEVRGGGAWRSGSGGDNGDDGGFGREATGGGGLMSWLWWQRVVDDGAWESGSNRSGYGDQCWYRSEKPAEKVFRRWWWSAVGVVAG
ncbi:hypothetical protein Tco_1572702 [Tanacetum coccineum]